MSEKQPSKVDPVGSYDDTLDEHRECDQFIARLEASLDSPPDEAGLWVGGLLEHLPGLARTLREHFNAEESGSLFTDLPRRRPRFASRLEALKDEHPGILDEVNKIIDLAGGLHDGKLHELRGLNARIQLFVARLRRHEAVENELIFEVYWDDIGAGD